MDGFSDLIEKKKKLKAGIDELVNQRQQVKEQQRAEQKAYSFFSSVILFSCYELE